MRHAVGFESSAAKVGGGLLLLESPFLGYRGQYLRVGVQFKVHVYDESLARLINMMEYFEFRYISK